MGTMETTLQSCTKVLCKRLVGPLSCHPPLGWRSAPFLSQPQGCFRSVSWASILSCEPLCSGKNPSVCCLPRRAHWSPAQNVPAPGGPSAADPHPSSPEPAGGEPGSQPSSWPGSSPPEVVGEMPLVPGCNHQDVMICPHQGLSMHWSQEQFVQRCF